LIVQQISHFSRMHWKQSLEAQLHPQYLAKDRNKHNPGIQGRNRVKGKMRQIQVPYLYRKISMIFSDLDYPFLTVFFKRHWHEVGDDMWGLCKIILEKVIIMIQPRYILR
ncbi:hypothetical protein ACJX0J_007850, partial [Zea mays]